MRKITIFLLIFLLILILILPIFASSENKISYVNPFIGTGGHGHTFPGATLPFGMVQLSPDTGIEGWDWCSGYHYSDNSIMGFSHTHFSGTGCADYGEVRIMPIVGNLQTIPGPKEDPSKGYRSKFRHETEIAQPGYYSVFLDDYKVLAELTASQRVGFHRYTFPKSDSSYIIIDLYHRIGDMAEKAWVRIIGNDDIEGYITGGHFCGCRYPHTIYFVAKFSKPFEEFGTWKVFKISKGNREEIMRGKSEPFIGAYVRYSTKEKEQILIKVALSYTGIEGARKNLQEIPHWNFDKVKEEALKKWEEILSLIEVEGSKEDKIKFYTALYHSFIHPNIFSDIDGKYIGVDDKIYQADYPHYTVYSLWDTFRSLHPLFILIQPQKNIEFIKSFLDIYNQSGWLPRWHKANKETNCMIGTHADSVIADAIVKGLRDFDLQKAYEAMYKNAMVKSSSLNNLPNNYNNGRIGIEEYKKIGYVPGDMYNQSVSMTLEYAYNDFCLAQVAKILGKEEDYKLFIKRAQNYKNLYDPKVGFMRAKKSNGDWVDSFPISLFKKFDPTDATSPHYTEGNAWQWTFFAPQDPYGLIKLLGGEERFVKKLDEFFTTKVPIKGPPDITGLIGQYAHGNEPSHHIAYFYVYVKQPWKTQELIRKILDELYGITPDGLPGNEDCGQMSAWYIFSSLGFYPFCPGTPIYILGTPTFEKAIVHFPSGKELIITAENISKENKYVQEVYLNGKPLNRAWIWHNEIINGGTLIFIMGKSPNKNWGTILENLPPNFIQ
jgi:predicted alpha-1,2-mannosidase